MQGRPCGAYPRVVDDPVFGLYAYGGTLKNGPDSIQIRFSDGLNFRFFNLTDRYELICGGSRGQPNEFWNLQHLT
ncbi:MAG: hypothetical protein OXH72_12635 [Caldilineaceae bacterium]|nr:hypothetical protein [Caldilineaceae bacterium]